MRRAHTHRACLCGSVEFMSQIRDGRVNSSADSPLIECSFASAALCLPNDKVELRACVCLCVCVCTRVQRAYGCFCCFRCAAARSHFQRSMCPHQSETGAAAPSKYHYDFNHLFNLTNMFGTVQSFCGTVHIRPCSKVQFPNLII